MAEAAAQKAAAGQATGLVIINLQSTPLDADASIRIWGLLDNVLKLLAKELKLGKGALQQSATGRRWVDAHPSCKYRTPLRKPTDGH